MTRTSEPLVPTIPVVAPALSAIPQKTTPPGIINPAARLF
jgi:hypothetical protein